MKKRRSWWKKSAGRQMALVVISLCLSIVLVVGLTAFRSPSTAASKPNVLLISLDDLKDWVGFLQGYEGKVYTPNLDRLAELGVAFTNAHTAATVCCPSRNAMMLGKRPSTTGLYDNGQWWKAALPEEISMPQYFRQHGYHTAGAGKVFHHTPGNNPPCSWDEYQDQVFDDPWNFAEWPAERYFLDYGYRGPIVPFPEWKPLNGLFPHNTESDWGPIPGKKEEDYGDVQAVNFAKAFLQKKHEQPFFLAIGLLTKTSFNGAVLQMISHGLMTALFFAVIGMIYERTHTREVSKMSGLLKITPFISSAFIIVGLCSLGLPGLSGFVAEMTVFMAGWQKGSPFYMTATVMACASIVVTAVYILRVIGSVIMGPLKINGESKIILGDAYWNEKLATVLLMFGVLIVGLLPFIVLKLIDPATELISLKFGK